MILKLTYGVEGAYENGFYNRIAPECTKKKFVFQRSLMANRIDFVFLLNVFFFVEEMIVNMAKMRLHVTTLPSAKNLKSS